jgi:hypothetical protein
LSWRRAGQEKCSAWRTFAGGKAGSSPVRQPRSIAANALAHPFEAEAVGRDGKLHDGLLSWYNPIFRSPYFGEDP